METKTLTVGSITYAQRARNLLMGHGIASTLVRTRQSGCSYGVRLDATKIEDAMEYLRSAGLKTEVT